MAEVLAPDTRLDRAAALFLVGFLIHNGDHVRRTLDGITDTVVWAGTGVAVLAGVVLTLIVTRHAFGPLVAAGAGLYIAIGVSVSHLLPRWSALSDPLVDGDVDAFTWFAVLAEIFGALVLGVVGLRTHLASRRRPTVPV